MSPTCPHAYSDGAYVLGALSPAERAAYQRHLAECDECAAAVAALAPIPGLLSRVDPATLELDAPGPGRLPQLLQAVAGQRRSRARRRRWRQAAVTLAACLVAVAGTVVGLEVLAAPDPAPDPPAAQMQPVATTVPVTAQVTLTEHPAGTEVRLWCAYPPVADLPGYDPAPRVFRLVAVGADGSSEQLGSWLAGPGDELTMTGITQFTGSDLAWLELRGADGAELLRYTP